MSRVTAPCHSAALRPSRTGHLGRRTAPPAALGRAAAPRRLPRAAAEDGAYVAPAAPREPARSQRDALWARHEATVYAELPPLAAAPLAAPLRAAGILGRMLVDPFFRSSPVFAPFGASGDTRPARTKLFHPFGALAMARLEFFGSPYDGILRDGGPCLVRLSLGSSDANYVPGLALLIPVAGAANVSLVAVNSLDAQASRDFFRRPLSTQFPPATGAARVLEAVLGLLSAPRGIDPRRVSVQPLADIDADGAAVHNGRAPPSLTFCHPQHHLPDDDRRDFRTALAATCRPGDTLYEVYAEGRPIGRLVLESAFSASSFADRELAIRHHA